MKAVYLSGLFLFGLYFVLLLILVLDPKYNIKSCITVENKRVQTLHSVQIYQTEADADDIKKCSIQDLNAKAHLIATLEKLEGYRTFRIPISSEGSLWIVYELEGGAYKEQLFEYAYPGMTHQMVSVE